MGRALEHLRPWTVPLGLSALLIILQVAGLREALAYSREAVQHGELWRLLTGNLLHLGWVHLVRDLLGLGLIWWLVSSYLSERGAIWVLSVSALAVGIGLLLFSPKIAWYVGISGALFGLYTAGVLRMCKESLLLGSALLLGMLGVLAWSLYAGGLPRETTGLGGAVIPQAHLYGSIGGAMALAALELLKREESPGVLDGR